jgi:hypothetical protein
MEMDDFQGFHDPLEGMDLSGLEGMTGGNQGQWDELQTIMGDKVDVAPALQEAVVATEGVSVETPEPTSAERETAEAVDGAVSVPPIELTESVPIEADVSTTASGVPTEEVNEMPSNLPPAVEDLSGATEPVIADATEGTSDSV